MNKGIQKYMNENAAKVEAARILAEAIAAAEKTLKAAGMDKEDADCVLQEIWEASCE